MDLYSLLNADEPTAQEKAAAYAQALRRDKAAGLLAAMTGNKLLAPVGQSLQKDAAAGEQDLQQVGQFRLGQTLRKQEMEQRLAQQKAAEGRWQQEFGETQRHNRATERNAGMRLDLAGRGTGSAQGGDDIEAIADAIASGQQPPELKGLYRYGAPVRAALAKRGVDLTTMQRDWGAVQKHTATLNGQQQERLRQAIDFTTHQTGNIEELYNEWQRVAPTSGFRVFNRAALATAKQMGGEAGAIAQALEAQIADLTSEMGNVYMGGNSPTDHSLKLAAQNLAANWDEPTFKKALGLIKTNLTLRRSAMLNSPVAGLSENSPYAPRSAAPAMSAEDQQAKQWAESNPADPRSAKILEKLKAKGL